MRFKIGMKRTLVTLMVLMMVATSLPIPLWAKEPTAKPVVPLNYDKMEEEKVKYINNTPLYQPADLGDDPTKEEEANQQIADPPMPKTYTYEMDYLVPRNRQYLPAYQPYIATVGDEGMVTSDEKARISQSIPSPRLVGYTVTPKKTDISYKIVKEEAEKGEEVVKGQSWEKIVPYMYQPSQNYVKVRHTFQELDDPEKFGQREKGKDIWTYLRGQVGYDQPLQPCDNVEDRVGFEPEPNLLKVCIPDVVASDDTGVELRYFRKRYDLIFDTVGGTPIPSRKLIYGQTIPYIEEEPTKKGATFLGWKPNIDLHYVRDDGSKDILVKGHPFKFSELRFFKKGIKEAMPASSVTLTAEWKEKERANYTIQFWTQKAEAPEKPLDPTDPDSKEGYEFVGARIIENAKTTFRPSMEQDDILYTIDPPRMRFKNPMPPYGIKGMLPIKIKFPEIDARFTDPSALKYQGRNPMESLLTRYYTLNVVKTKEANLEWVNKDDGSAERMVKKVQSDDSTVYNIFYDRTKYTLLFEKNITPYNGETLEARMKLPDGRTYDSSKDANHPYTTEAKFGQFIHGWPNDFWLINSESGIRFAEKSSFYGWSINNYENTILFRDTPPYWLSSELFINPIYGSPTYGVTQSTSTGERFDEKYNGKRVISLGPTSSGQPNSFTPDRILFALHFLEYQFQGLDKLSPEDVKNVDKITWHYNPELAYTKIDTSSQDYGNKAPQMPGFTPVYSRVQASSGQVIEANDPDELMGVLEEGEEDREVNERSNFTLLGTLLGRDYFKNFEEDQMVTQISGIPFANIPKYRYSFKYFRNQYNLLLDTDPRDMNEHADLANRKLADGRSAKISGVFYHQPLRLLNLDKEYQLTDRDRPAGIPEDYVFKGWALDPAGNKMIQDENCLPKIQEAEDAIFPLYEEFSGNKYDLDDYLQTKEKITKAKQKLISVDSLMPNYDIILYAIWRKRDLYSKVMFDPNFDPNAKEKGAMEDLNPINIATHKLGASITTTLGPDTYTMPEKLQNEKSKVASRQSADVQVFKVRNRMTIYQPNEPNIEGEPNKAKDPFNFIVPTRPGYDFHGWELVRFKKDGTVDDSYFRTYGVPELYAFGNEVVGDVYLKAIWVKNELKDIKIVHHFLDQDLNELSKTENIMPKQRVGTYVYTTGSEQGPKDLLVSDEELTKKKERNNQYAAYKEETNRINSFYQNLRIMTEADIKNVNDKRKAEQKDPLSKEFINTFHYFYRPFRQRHYQVNYLGFKDLEKAKNDPSQLAPIADRPNPAATDANYLHIIQPESVTNGNRDYDARNYRHIPGWKLLLDPNGKPPVKPQVQLKFDLNDTGVIQGINGVTAKNGILPQVNFYYQDVRVIPRKGKGSVTPTGYHRITFIADEGGSFGTDKDGKEIKELYYDVIDGLEFGNFDKLVPVAPDKTAASSYAAKIQVQPGYQFKAWEKSSLLDPNTVIRGNYTFTATFIKLKLPEAKEIVVFESWKDGEGKLVNNFLPKTPDYDDAMAAFKPEEFTGYTLKDTDDRIYEKLKEQVGDPSDQPPRHESIAAEIAWKGGSPFPVQIPVKVFKNIYRALDDSAKPRVFQDNAKVLEHFVKVTVDPTDLAQNKQKKTYYVNPDAKVLIPNENVKPIPGYIFKGWRYKDSNQGEQAIDLAQRHQIPSERTIYAVFEKESEFSATEITVPESYKDGNTWVNSFLPSTDDLKNALTHNGKTASLPTDATVEFGDGDANSWQPYSSLDKALYNKLQEKDNPDGKSSRTEYVTAKITTGSKVAFVEIPIKVIKNIYEGKTLEGKPEYVPVGYVKVILDPTQHAKFPQKTVYYVNPKAKVLIPGEDPEGIDPYSFVAWRLGEDGTGEKHTLDTRRQFQNKETFITATYQSPEIISYDPQDPEARPTGYWRVTFEHDAGLRFANNPKPKAYLVRHDAGKKLGDPDLVKPSVEALTGYSFEKWDKKDDLVIQSDLTVTAQSKVIPDSLKKDKNTPKPEGYVEIVFVAGDHGTVPETTYFVNPTKYLTLDPPAATPNTGYEFSSWDKDPRIPTQYTAPITTITATFTPIGAVQTKKKPGYVMVTFEIQGDGGSFAEGEVVTYYVDPNQEVTLPVPHVIADTGYKFKDWERNPQVPTIYKEPTTIKGTFLPLDSVIPIENPEKPEVPKPDGYVKVTFKPGTGGTLDGAKVYYVNPKVVKKLSDLTHPTIKPFTGYQANGWDIDSDTPLTSNLTVTAQYLPEKDVIEKTKEDDSEQPKGYIKVIFDTTEKGTIDGTNPGKSEKTVFVNPNKPVILQDFAPKVSPKTGNEFARWDVDLQKATVYKDGDRIHALYNTLDNIKTEETPGYVKVIFNQGEHGTLSGITSYWVKPGVKVTLPAPFVKPNLGYRFDQWDKDLEVKATAGSDIVITAKYASYPPIMPDPGFKPEGYVKVSFKADEHGKLQGTTVYYVDPQKSVDLTPIADAIDKKPDIGYRPDSWNKEIPSNAKILQDTDYTFRFEAIPDVIKEEEGKTEDRPEGYVRVTFIPTAQARPEWMGMTSFWVNPTKLASMSALNPEGRTVEENGVKFTYNFLRWSATRGVIPDKKTNKGEETEVGGLFTQDTEITAQYSKSLALVPLVAAPVPKKDYSVTVGKEPKAEDLIENIPGSGPNALPKDTIITYVPGKEPDVSRSGETTAKVQVKYPDGKTVVVDVKVTVAEKVLAGPSTSALYIPVEGKVPTVEEYKTVLSLPEKAALQSVSILANPDLSRVGQTDAKIKVTYTNGQTFTVQVPIVVFDDVIEQEDGDSIPDWGN